MRRWLTACSLTMGLLWAASSVQAGNWHDFWHRAHVDWHRNNAWPEPFVSADRAAQRAPFCMMVDNGWKMQNTIGTFLYDPNTNEVNQAGELLVKWIVQQAPPHRRAVFVLKGDSPEATQVRLESVQAAVAKYACNGEIAPVILTHTEPPGWPAQYVDQMTQSFQATMPAPRLPAAADGGGESGGGGSGGQ